LVHYWFGTHVLGLVYFIDPDVCGLRLGVSGDSTLFVDTKAIESNPKTSLDRRVWRTATSERNQTKAAHNTIHYSHGQEPIDTTHTEEWSTDDALNTPSLKSRDSLRR
jgi:hypothetical protein